MKIKEPRKPETRKKVIFVLSKKPAREIGSKIKDKPGPKLVKIATFWDKCGNISFHITSPPLGPLSEMLRSGNFLKTETFDNRYQL